uniref:Reverse transcriptase domain-containing protein n=1 Tax=Mesocestoides corti TaxID=53468 RepID=A0A5K3G345_MESCO
MLSSISINSRFQSAQAHGGFVKTRLHSLFHTASAGHLRQEEDGYLCLYIGKQPVSNRRGPRCLRTEYVLEHSGVNVFCDRIVGLTNAASTCQRVVKKLVHGLLQQKCLVYLDDIRVFSSTKNEIP